MCLEDARDAFESVGKGIALLGVSRDMRYSKTCCPLVQYQFPCINHLGKLLEQSLNGAGIWYQVVNDLGPGFVQALVPNTCRKELDRILEALARLPDVLGALVEHGLAQARLHEIHLVYEAKDLGAGTAFVEGADDI